MARRFGSSSGLGDYMEGYRKMAAAGAQTTAHDLIDKAERGKAQAIAAVSTIASAIRRSAADLESEGNDHLVTALRRGATRLSSLGQTLQQRSVDDLVGQTTRWVRANPLTVIAGGVLVGIAVSELVARSRRNAHAEMEEDDAEA